MNQDLFISKPNDVTNYIDYKDLLAKIADEQAKFLIKKDITANYINSYTKDEITLALKIKLLFQNCNLDQLFVLLNR